MIVRWLICVATAICLLAAPGARPDDWRTDGTHLKQATAGNHVAAQPAIALATGVTLPRAPAARIARIDLVAPPPTHPPAPDVAARGPPQT